MRMRLRSAILSRVVPPLTEEVADEIICPADTSCSRMVPGPGARTVASARRWRAPARSARARTSCASALASSRVALSCSPAVMTCWANSSSVRRFWAAAMSAVAWAAVSAASAWSY